MANDNKDELFKQSLNFAIQDYENLFKEPPPIIGYDPFELLTRLKECIKNKVELKPIEYYLKENGIIEPDDLVDI